MRCTSRPDTCSSCSPKPYSCLLCRGWPQPCSRRVPTGHLFSCFDPSLKLTLSLQYSCKPRFHGREHQEGRQYVIYFGYCSSASVVTQPNPMCLTYPLAVLSHFRPRFAYVLGHYRPVRSQGGRQPAVAKPPFYIPGVYNV